MLPRIKELRNEYHISQQELANAVLVSQQSIYKYENKNVDPSIDTLIKIAKFFNVSVDYLIGISDTKEIAKKSSSIHLLTEEISSIHEFRLLDPCLQKIVISIIHEMQGIKAVSHKE